MKKLFLLTITIIVISYIICTLFYNDIEIKFNFNENTFVRVKRNSSGNIDVVPLEEYTLGVVAGEMPIDFDIEALKAQAVAARTYVMNKMEQNKNNDYDVIDTVSNQVYLDNQQLKNKWGNKYTEDINKLKEVINDTKGEYLEYNGEVINAFFFSTSDGKTENSEDVFSTALPYLRSVDSMWDKDVSPVFSVQVKYSLNDFYAGLNIPYNDKISTEIISTTSTGRIKQIKINGSLFTGSDVASKLNLRSSYFNITQDGNEVYITTRGYGHGVGMSQYGAFGMAKAGYKYDEILKYYYQGVEIVKI